MLSAGSAQAFEIPQAYGSVTRRGLCWNCGVWNFCIFCALAVEDRAGHLWFIVGEKMREQGRMLARYSFWSFLEG